MKAFKVLSLREARCDGAKTKTRRRNFHPTKLCFAGTPKISAVKQIES